MLKSVTLTLIYVHKIHTSANITIMLRYFHVHITKMFELMKYINCVIYNNI